MSGRARNMNSQTNAWYAVVYGVVFGGRNLGGYGGAPSKCSHISRIVLSNERGLNLPPRMKVAHVSLKSTNYEGCFGTIAGDVAEPKS